MFGSGIPVMPIRRGQDEWGRWSVWVECRYPEGEDTSWFRRSFDIKADSMAEAREKIYDFGKGIGLEVKGFA